MSSNAPRFSFDRSRLSHSQERQNDFDFGDEASMASNDGRLQFTLPDGVTEGEQQLNQFDNVAPVGRPPSPPQPPEAIIRDDVPHETKSSMLQDNQERFIEFEPMHNQHDAPHPVAYNDISLRSAADTHINQLFVKDTPYDTHSERHGEGPGTPPNHPSEDHPSGAPLYSDVRDRAREPGTPESGPLEVSLERAEQQGMSGGVHEGPPVPPQRPIPFPFFKPASGSNVYVDIASVASVLHHDVNARRFMKRLIYSVLYFALVATIMALHTDVTEAHHLTTLLSNKFVKPRILPSSDVTLREVTTADQVYLWFYNVWAPGMFGEFSVDALQDSTRLMMTDYNRVVQTPYIKMSRRKPADSCYGKFLQMPPSRLVSDIPLYCHSGMIDSTMLLNDRTYTTVKGVDYPSDGEGGDNFYTVFRISTLSYGASGGSFMMYNITNLTTARTALSNLREDGFFTEETSELETDIVVYNPYINVIGALRVEFSFADTGSVTAFQGESVLQIRRLKWYGTDKDTARFILELAFMIATFADALFTYASIRRARRRGASVLAYFTSRSWSWNLFEVLYVAVALVVFSLYVRLLVEQPALPEDVQLIDDRFDPFSDLYAASKSMNCLLIAISGVKVIRFMGFLPGFTVLFATFQRIVQPLLMFVILFLILCIGFSVAGLYAFGSSDPRMQTFGKSLLSVISFFTGDVSYTSLTGAERDVTKGVFPPMYYWAMFFALCVIVWGVIIAIAVVSHAQARKEEHDRQRIKTYANKWRAMAPRKQWWAWIPGASFLDPFPKTLLETLGEGGKRWIVPIMHDYKAASLLVAEVGAGTLRVYVSVQSWFQRKLVGASGFAVVLPPGAFLPNIVRSHKGSFAKVRPGQALRLTTEPLLGTEEFDFVVDGNVIRTKGVVDLGMASDHQVVLEFPGVINDAYRWPNSEVVVSVDTVQRIATYGGSFTHAPADWLVCAVGAPSALSLCPYLVLEPSVPLEDLLLTVENSGIEAPEAHWRHSVTCLSQLFSRTVDAQESQLGGSPRLNPLDTETAWVKEGQHITR